MPNTLAHLGLQTIVARAVVGAADVKWIFLSCIVPDVPWILRRIVVVATDRISSYDSLLYATIQASLAGCLLLAAACAVFAAAPRRIFVILASGSLFHLLLDAVQTKWGNGVHLLAPFSWHLMSFDLFWPEDLPTTGLTLLGAGCAGIVLVRAPTAPFDLRLPAPRYLLLGGLCLTAYFLAPVALLAVPERHDTRHVRTVRDVDDRPGKFAAFDRAVLTQGETGAVLKVFSGVEIHAIGGGSDYSGLVSTRGRFVSRDTYRIDEIHYHRGRTRDIASYVGLACVMLVWVRAWRGGRSPEQDV